MVGHVGDFVDVGIWSGIEIDVGCVCACLPAIRLLVLRYWSRWTTTASHATWDETRAQQRARLQASSIERNMLRKQSQGELGQAVDGDTFIMLYPTSTVAATYPYATGTVGDGKGQEDDVSLRYEIQQIE